MSVYDNGGIIGPTMNFANADQYIIGSTFTANSNSIVFIGGQTSNGLGTASVTNVTFSFIGGATTANTLRQDDIVVVAVATGSVNDRSFTSNIKGSDSVNYTSLADLYSNDTYDINLFVGYKIMGPIPDTHVSLTQGSFAATDGYSVGIFAFRGANTQVPLNAVVQTKTLQNTLRPDPPIITPNTGNSIIVVVGAGAYGGQATRAEFFANDLTGFVQTRNPQDTYDSVLGIGYVRQGSTAASFNSNTFVVTSITDNTQFSSAAVSLVIKPSNNTSITYGNSRRNSGVWSLDSVYDSMIPSTPVTFRYLRWVIEDTKGVPFGNLIQASEFVLQNNGVDISMAGTTVASTDPGQVAFGEIPSNLVDNNVITKYCTKLGEKPVTITFDLGSSKTVTAYRWATANDEEARDPTTWYIETSLDGVKWTRRGSVYRYPAPSNRRIYTRSWGFTD